MSLKILVTGCAGFIGSHLCEKLLENDNIVYGIDNINNYYSKSQKMENINNILKNSKAHNFIFLIEDLITTDLISKNNIDVVVNLGAMAGVRNSLENPSIYIDTNIKGQQHLLEECVKNNVKLFIYASSSSVYGINKKIPFSESDELNNINSPYAFTKKSGEELAKLYNTLYKINTIGLRFFTVYGPRGRPDMLPFKILDSIINDKEFLKYGDGSSSRDYTYIDDVIDGIISSIDYGLKKINDGECINEIYNLGNSNSVNLNEFIKICENITNKKSKYKEIDVQKGDVPITFANISKAKNHFNFDPKISLEEGLKRTYEWMKATQHNSNND